MGNDIPMILLVGVIGVLGYKFLIQNKDFLGGGNAAATDPPIAAPIPADLPPPSKADTAAKEPVPSDTMQEATNQLITFQVTNNNFYVQDFDVKVGKGVQISPTNHQLLLYFNPDRYMHDSHYRRAINIIIAHLPNRRERDYWDDLTDALDRRIKQKQRDDDDRRRRIPSPRPVPIPLPRPRPFPGNGGHDDDHDHNPPPKPCVQKVACAATTHWDSHLCKCVANNVPSASVNFNPITGGNVTVDGASSNYSRNTLVNNPGRLFYW